MKFFHVPFSFQRRPIFIENPFKLFLLGHRGAAFCARRKFHQSASKHNAALVAKQGWQKGLVAFV
jgi:hypothetical protein